MVTKAVLILAGLLVGAGIATAAPAWRVVASGTGTGDYAIANVSASIDNPNAVAVRSNAGTAEVTWSLLCSGKTKVQRGRIYVLTTSGANDCNVSALGSGSGRVIVQVLKR